MAMRNRRILVLTPYEAAAKLPAAINRRQMPTDRLGFIGAGRVAKGLSLALSRCGYSISGVAGRAAGDAQRVVEASEIVFLSVPDDAIGAVCAGLRWRAGQAAVHCAGATELAVLQPAADAGAAIGGFHPLVMFADPEIAARSIAGAAIGIEAEEPVGGRLRRIAEALGAAGFVGALVAQGVEIWRRIGIPPEDAPPALFGLLRGAIEAMAQDGIGARHGGFHRARRRTEHQAPSRGVGLDTARAEGGAHHTRAGGGAARAAQRGNQRERPGQRSTRSMNSGSMPARCSCTSRASGPGSSLYARSERSVMRCG